MLVHSEILRVLQMPSPLVLASGSEIRRKLLLGAGVPFGTAVASIDETGIRTAMQADGAHPHDIADALAETKARRVSATRTPALVLGCDQILAHGGEVLAKPGTLRDARHQLCRLRGQTHYLCSAAVICERGEPVWRHVALARLTMSRFSDSYLDAYLRRNWPAIRHCVGGYKLEEEGVRLFSRIEGDYFGILGLPLVEILAYLGRRGVIDT